MRKHLNTIIPLAFSLALIILPPAITGRLRMFAAAPLRPLGEAESLLIRRAADRAAQACLAAYAANRAANRTENSPPDGRTVPAAVIFKGGTGALHRTLYIDRGTLDGVREGMPVVCGGALVGVVNAAGPAMSEVIALGDPRLKVSALLVPRNPTEATPPSDERIEGILAGTAKEDSPLRLHYIWRGVSVAKGDLVATSGYDGRFPRGLVAGYVSGVTDKRDDLHHEIEIEPAAPFDGVDQVLVLTDWPVEVRLEEVSK